MTIKVRQRERDQNISKFFDTVEVLRVLDSLPERLAILDMASVIADAGVKDVVERMPAKEEVADDPQTFPVTFMSPQPPQILDGVYALLLLPHHLDETAVSDMLLPQQTPHFPLVLLDEADNSLPEVLRDVFSLVLGLLLADFLQVFHRQVFWREVELEHWANIRLERVGEIEVEGRGKVIGKLDFLEGEKGEGVEGEGLEIVVGGVEVVELVVGVSRVGQLEFEVVDHSWGYLYWEELAGMQMQQTKDAFSALQYVIMMQQNALPKQICTQFNNTIFGYFRRKHLEIRLIQLIKIKLPR